MLTNSEIIEKFEITKGTLYNWIKTKPSLYTYLQNADEKYLDFRNITMILEKHSKNIKKDFLYDEIEFILSLKLEFHSIEDIENLHLIYANHIKNSQFTLGIFIKIERLDLIEKYIFSQRVKSISLKKNMTKEDKIEITRHYFKEFLSVK